MISHPKIKKTAQLQIRIFKLKKHLFLFFFGYNQKLFMVSQHLMWHAILLSVKWFQHTEFKFHIFKTYFWSVSFIGLLS